MKFNKFNAVVFFCIFSLHATAQKYTPKVSRDSIAILTSRTEVLKSAIKVNDLKLAEGSQESDIEKLELKIVELRSLDKASSDESLRLSESLQTGNETDLKKVDRAARKAASNAKSLKNALEKLNKQIDKAEDIKNQIQTEERKLSYRDLLIIFMKNNN